MYEIWILSHLDYQVLDPFRRWNPIIIVWIWFEVLVSVEELVGSFTLLDHGYWRKTKVLEDAVKLVLVILAPEWWMTEP